MSSDISRQRFNPANHFSSVLMQQGRVQLDADWNEGKEILDRRWRSETIDIIGRGVVPRETPQGFEIQLSGGKLTIGRGRIYVDGLQAENHGAGDLEFDPILGEQRGLDPVPYDQQPYFPNAIALPEAGGPLLVFLDVWQREVTAIEDPRLIESAVGVDTTTRLQTVWQVRVLPNVGSGTTCAMPDDQVPGWLEIIRASDGRLTTAAVGVATIKDPCLVPPSGGYRGLENKLYRVEIHEGGAVGAATFKWSRDNASVATNISRIEGDNTLTVDRTGWDSARGFRPGDWVEITDDWREFSGAPGEVRRIATVEDASRTITLATPLTAGLFPVDGQNLTDPTRHTRIKRWDQSGLVQDSSGGTFHDLNAPGGTGLIPVPAAGTSLLLEDGVQVTFTTAQTGGQFRPGDYWVFAARTADASVEALDKAPPRGVHHHYCRLALVTFPGTVVDCRTFWPPAFGGGESCDCTLCVNADEHNQGTFTIHQAVNQLHTTGGTICLGPGIFNLLQNPVRLDGAFAVRIRGQGAATVLIQPRGDAAFVFRRSQWCSLDYLTIHTIAGATAAPAIRLSNSLGTTIERLIISPPAEGDGPLAGVLLEAGFLLRTRIRDNFMRARFGVAFVSVSDTGGTAPGAKGTLLLNDFRCESNALQCQDTGVQLGGSSYYANGTVIAQNLITGTTVAGIAVTGFALAELGVTGNTIAPAKGDGIVIGTGGARVSDNAIGNPGGGAEHGIRLVPGLFQIAISTILVSENRLQGLGGNGLALETRVISARIERNVFSGIEGQGVVMLDGSAAGSLSVSGNELLNVGTGSAAATRARELAAIHLQNVFQGLVSDNMISGVGSNAALAAVIAGIRVDGCLEVRVSDNSISNLAPVKDFANLAAGVLVIGPIASIEIADNSIRRRISPSDPDNSPWQAIRISGVLEKDTFNRRFASFRNLSAISRVNALSSFAAASARNVEDAGICANALHGYGRSAVAEVLVTGSCRFSDNHCEAAGQQLKAAVALAAASINAATNRIESGRDIVALDLKVSRETAFTVLGNITGGPIQVNGGLLGAPWQPLNVLAP
ncbi:MAG: hypothetical protein QOE70_849 [Chthoniobacter sp.]|jgi:hypothetical protein|nr:hypothetical protein [Chthoniobacter sp.]